MKPAKRLKLKIAASIMAAAMAISAASQPVNITHAADTFNSYGIIDSSDPSGDKVVIDADDIRANAQAIYQIKKQLGGLDGRAIKWSDELGTYVIVTYETDENGDIVYDADGNPKVASEDPVGALGTADPRMVVENVSFTSQYAKGSYGNTDSNRSPGVEQNGTLVDVLGNGFGAGQLSGTPWYAAADTSGTGTSHRNKGSSPTDESSLLPGSQRAQQVAVDWVEYTDTSFDRNSVPASAPARTNGEKLPVYNGQYTSQENGAHALDKNNTDITLGANESITLPAGYYSDAVTINNGVVNQTNTGRLTITGTSEKADTESNNKTASAGNKKATVANGVYSIDQFNASGAALSLGAEGRAVLPAGYYSKNILVQNTSKDILSGKYSSYEMEYFNPTSTSGAASFHPDITAFGSQDIVLDINEKIILPAGYYSKQVAIGNGVVNKSAEGKITIYDTVPQIDPDKSNKSSNSGNRNITAPNGEHAIGSFNATSRPLSLGAEGKVLLSAGYYGNDILIENTSKDIISGEYSTYSTADTNPTTEQTLGTNGTQKVHPTIDKFGTDSYVLGINDKVTIPAGYYSKEVVFENGVVNRSRNDSINITGTVASIDEAEDNKTASAGNKHHTLTGEQAIGTLNATTNTIGLGAEAKATLPAGYYANDIVVENTSKNIISGEYSTYSTADTNPTTEQTLGTNGAKKSHPTIDKFGTDSYVLGINDKVTIPAGYYSKEVVFENGVVNRSRNDSINITGTVASIDEAEDNKTASAGNKHHTLTGEQAIGTLNATTNTIGLGAEAKATLPAGYYANDIVVENTAKDIISGEYATYSKGTYDPATGTDGTTSAYPAITELGTKPVVVNINESVTLPAGYYSKQVTFANGVVNQTTHGKATWGETNKASGTAGNNSNKSSTSDKIYPLYTVGINEKVTFPAGYYSAPITAENGVVDVLKNNLNATGAYHETGNNQGLKSLWGSSTQVSKTHTTESLALDTSKVSSIPLAINEKITFPAGYYSVPVTVRNNIEYKQASTRTAASPTIQTVDDKQVLRVTVPETGYYEKDSSYLTVDVGNVPRRLVVDGQTFTSTSGVKTTGTMPNKSGATQDALSADISNGKIRLAIPTTGYYTKANSTYGENQSYITAVVGDVTPAMVVKGQTFTSKSGVNIQGTMETASVTGSGQSDGSFKYSIAAQRYTGSGSSGTISKLTPQYSANSSQGSLKPGGTATLPANTYNKDSLQITAASMTENYDIPASGYTKSGTTLTWDMTATNLKRYVRATALTTTDLTVSGGAYNSLNAGGTVKIPKGRYTDTEITITAKTLASQTSDATAGKNDILSGKSAYVNGSKIDGGMTNNGNVTKTLNPGESYTIAWGYHSGGGTVTANKNVDKYTCAKPADGNDSSLLYDIGETTRYKEVDTKNVYAKGYEDGYAAGGGGGTSGGVTEEQKQAIIKVGAPVILGGGNYNSTPGEYTANTDTLYCVWGLDSGSGVQGYVSGVSAQAVDSSALGLSSKLYYFYATAGTKFYCYYQCLVFKMVF